MANSDVVRAEESDLVRGKGKVWGSLERDGAGWGLRGVDIAMKRSSLLGQGPLKGEQGDAGGEGEDANGVFAFYFYFILYVLIFLFFYREG